MATSATVPTEAPKTTTTLTASAPLGAATTTRRPVVTTVAPKPVTAVQTTPAANLCGAPPNPYCYNYCGRGGYISPPAQDICTYFSCIGNFWNGKGYMEECNDGMVSMSGGRPGACSYHGGELRPVTG